MKTNIFVNFRQPHILNGASDQDIALIKVMASRSNPQKLYGEVLEIQNEWK